MKSIFAVNTNISCGEDKFNNLSSAQFHLWWCQACGHGSLDTFYPQTIYKIKLYEVENIIKAYPDVQYCIISPLYDSEKFGNVAIADIVLHGNMIPSRPEQVAFVEKLLQAQFINNADVSARQIPAWFRFRESLPLTVNSKINYHALSKEPLNGQEIAVHIEETNISVDKITVE